MKRGESAKKRESDTKMESKSKRAKVEASKEGKPLSIAARALGLHELHGKVATPKAKAGSRKPKSKAKAPKNSKVEEKEDESEEIEEVEEEEEQEDLEDSDAETLVLGQEL